MSNHEDVLDELFATLFLEWAQGGGPADPMEGVHPEFARMFGQTATEFTFERFRHSGVTAGWTWQAIEFPGEGDGALFLYRPDSWPNILQKGLAAQLLTHANTPRQSLFVTAMASWAQELPSFCRSVSVVGFDFLPFAEARSRWVFATRSGSGHWCWGAYREGDWVVVLKGDASDDRELTEQLVALVNGDPWGWGSASR